MFCLNSNDSIPEIHPGPDICAWVHRRSCTGDVEKPGLFHKMLWADLIKPIFESCAWPHWIPVQREVRSRWLPRSKERGEIYFSAPGKFCPSCGHQVTYNQILKMKKCQYKTTYRLRSEICGFIVLYLWIYCLYLHIYRRCLIYYICWLRRVGWLTDLGKLSPKKVFLWNVSHLLPLPKLCEAVW